MKKTILAVAAVIASVGAWGQGQVNFSNVSAVIGYDAQVFDSDNTTPLMGPAYLAQLYTGASDDALAPVGATTGFLDIAALPGQFNGGVRTIDGVAGGADALLQVRAWEASGGDTYEAAVSSGAKFGSSASFTRTLGGGGTPPAPASNLGSADNPGIQSFSLVPEPSTAALGILGAVALMLRRRK